MDKSKAKTKTLQLVLILSLAINLFFAGFFISKYMYRSEHQKTPPERLYAAVELLEPQYRDGVRTILDEQVPKVEANFEKMFFLFQNMRSTMASSDFEPQQMMGFRSQVMERHQEMASTFAQTMMRISMALPPDQRKIFFEAALPETPPFIPAGQAKKILKKSAQ